MHCFLYPVVHFFSLTVVHTGLLTVSHCWDGTVLQITSLTEKHCCCFSTLYLVVHTEVASSEHWREEEVVHTF